MQMEKRENVTFVFLVHPAKFRAEHLFQVFLQAALLITPVFTLDGHMLLEHE